MSNRRNHMQVLGASLATVVLAAGMLAGCARGTQDRVENVRHSLQTAGLKSVGVADDLDKGVMTLNGQVSSDGDKALAESIARSMAGGQVVANQIAVIPPGFEKRAKIVNADLDKGIDQNLDAALLQEDLHRNVSYRIKNGVVTLRGDVPSERLRSAVESVAARVPNVQQVVNELQVKNQKASSSN